MTVRPRYVRRRSYDRLRHSDRFLAWLEAQADRLSLTARLVFDLFLVSLGMSYREVENLEEGDYEAPENTVAPAITGTAQEGETLTASEGTWTGSPEPTLAFQWNRDDEPIAGATEDTYDLVADDVDAVITVTVTATNIVGTASETSAGTDPVIAAD